MKILFIIAKKDFQDTEFQVPYDYLKNKGLIIDIASTEKGTCIGKFGTPIVADRSLSDVVIQEYFTIVLIGGPGSVQLSDNLLLHKIIQDAVKQDIIIAAICYAPVALAKAGALKGKKASVWNTNNLQHQILKIHGAEFVNSDVVVDKNIITANGPESAQKFAEELFKQIECEDCWQNG